MPRPELHHTLVAAVEALSPSAPTGLVISEAELDLPLEIVTGERDHKPVVAGSAPYSRWVTGFMPHVQLAHLRIELVPDPREAR